MILFYLLVSLLISSTVSAETYYLNTRKARNALTYKGSRLPTEKHDVVMDFNNLDTSFSHQGSLIFLFHDFYNKHNAPGDHYPYGFPNSCHMNEYNGMAISLKMGYPGITKDQFTYDFISSVMMHAASAKNPFNFLVTSKVLCRGRDNNYISASKITVYSRRM